MGTDAETDTTVDPDELDKLRDALRFTMTDTQRLLRASDVEHICPNKELCFEYGDHVRCAPCAIRQSEMHGVKPNLSLPFSPEEYRLKRRVRSAETETGVLNEALGNIGEAYRRCGDRPDELRDAIGAVVDRYGGFADRDFDPALISLSDEGHLVYAGVELLAPDDTPEPVTHVRRVEEWAMHNLTCLPGGRWRKRAK